MILVKITLFLMLFVGAVYADTPYVDDGLMSKIEGKYKVFAKKRFFYLQKTLDEVKSSSDMEKLNAVNDFFNSVRYTSDQKVYGVSDYWATPWEFLGKDMGDCEDYVISKYFALIYLGVDSKKLFFTYVKSTRFAASHMVLTYFETPRSEPLVLDNYNLKIFPASQRTDLTPIYNFNGESLYKANSAGGTGKKVNNDKAHKKWDELKLNMKRQKI
ncbi:transglutaminase-like cysteine peptidase [bacterium]|jgi:predicted transglutaminase-like cysteine proteinase|nr:transglutaminase-like cysteine peptidase [bacterium]MBU1433606.1 transglutaminase-like cysteine peptidase [bacterium]MBU1503213.1 transglutaminase-like cysteine peptidase [bacterium]